MGLDAPEAINEWHILGQMTGPRRLCFKNQLYIDITTGVICERECSLHFMLCLL